MKRLAIIGSGDLGQLIAYHAAAGKEFEIAGYYDDFKEKGSEESENIILGHLGEITQHFKLQVFDVLILAIGYKHFKVRKKIFSEFKGIIPFATMIHSSCYVDPGSEIGEGTVILPGCVFDRNVKIGDNVLVNTGCCIAHDSSVGDHSFLSPGVVIAGFSEIGSCCNIGINSTIIDNTRVGDHIQTGGGTVVITNLTQPGLYVGNPARFVR